MADFVTINDGISLPCCPTDFFANGIIDLHTPYIAGESPYATVSDAMNYISTISSSATLVWYAWCLYLYYPTNSNNTAHAYIQLGCD